MHQNACAAVTEHLWRRHRESNDRIFLEEVCSKDMTFEWNPTGKDKGRKGGGWGERERSFEVQSIFKVGVFLC